MSNTPKVARRAAVSARKAAQAANLSAVGIAAMREGQSQQGAIEAVKRTLGKVRPDSDKPSDKVLFSETRHTYQSGRMAFALYAGSNLPEVEQIRKARSARDAADATGKGKLATGQRRRTKVEQLAYDASRQSWSRLLRAAGLVAVSKSAGNTNAKGAKAPGSKAPVKAPVTGISAADAAKYVPPKSANKETAIAYIRQQAALLSSFKDAANQRALKASNETLPVLVCTAIEDFKRAIDAIK